VLFRLDIESRDIENNRNWLGVTVSDWMPGVRPPPFCLDKIMLNFRSEQVIKTLSRPELSPPFNLSSYRGSSVSIEHRGIIAFGDSETLRLRDTVGIRYKGCPLGGDMNSTSSGAVGFVAIATIATVYVYTWHQSPKRLNKKKIKKLGQNDAVMKRTFDRVDASPSSPVQAAASPPPARRVEVVASYSVPLRFDESYPDGRLVHHGKDPYGSSEALDESSDGGIIIMVGSESDDDDDIPLRGRRSRSYAFDETSPPARQRLSSCDGSSVSSSTSSSEGTFTPLTVPRRPNISFDPDVLVATIPKFDDYSHYVRKRLWGTTDEIYENAVRNSIEFASEGWDWRKVATDETMYLCQSSGELIHPVHRCASQLKSPAESYDSVSVSEREMPS